MTNLLAEWAGLDSPIARHVESETLSTLNAYRAQQNLIEEHVRIEQSVKEGGYGRRQVHELVQNASDAIQEAGRRGKVRLVLTNAGLYCANEGTPIDEAGATTILGAHLSRKRGAQIGHFGLGFKSVLGVTSEPHFYSKSGSFGFDAGWALEQVRAIDPTVDAAPVLRLGRPVDVHHDATKDAVLAQLLPWAATVVKLPIGPAGVALLQEEFAEFPPEFLLFAAHVEELVLEDQAAALTRTLRCKRVGDKLVLQEGKHKAAWRVFSQTVKTNTLPDAALADADQNTRERPELPLVWAVPVDGTKSRSRFWAFFPTETETTLSGILNAPWKTYSDRRNLQDGAFNQALLSRAVVMVTEAWPSLLDAEDPGRVLDLMTARPDDAKGWADRYLATNLDVALSKIASMPGRNGSLAKPESLRLRPDVILKPQAREWVEKRQDAESGQPLVDLSVEQRERRPRAARLGVKVLPTADWLGTMSSRGVTGSVRAVRLTSLLETLVDARERSLLLDVPIVLAEEGVRLSPKDRRLLLAAPDDQVDGCFVVASQLLAKQDVNDALKRWGVERPSPEARLRRAIQAGMWSDDGRREFWDAIATVPLEFAKQFIHDLTSQNPDAIVLKNMAGQWRLPSSMLLPGAVVPGDGSRDATLAVDMTFHAPTARLLPLLGLSDCPTKLANASKDETYQRYRMRCATEFRDSLPAYGRRPQESYLTFVQQDGFAPLGVLKSASDEARIATTEMLLPHVTEMPVWHMRHGTVDGYPTKEFPSLLRWVLSNDGLVNTSLGSRKPAGSVTGALACLHALLPVAHGDAESLGLLGAKTSGGELSETMWKEAWTRCEHSADADQVGRFYALAAAHRVRPKQIRAVGAAGWTLAAPEDVVVVTDVASLGAATSQGQCALLAPDDVSASLLEERWGLVRQAMAVRFEAAVEECRLDELVVTCKVPAGYAAQRVQLCSELWYESSGPAGAAKRYVDRAFENDVVYVRTTLSDEEILAFTMDKVSPDGTVEPAMPDDDRESHEERVQRARQATDSAERLLALLDAATIRTRVPAAVLAELEASGPLTDHQVAGAALAVFGVQVLREYQRELEASGLQTPLRWAGTPSARAFVEGLGFSQEFAGFESTRLDPMLEVEGPVALNPLHEFQRLVADRIIGMVAERSPSRGLVSLPTGAGKTRVAVQALIEAIKTGDLSGTILWIAQSEELCEQAVQAWRQAWRFLGPSARLRISRLWGATNNRIVPTRGHGHVVVATFQSLEGRISRDAYEWLREASCVVVDEAHGAVTPAYTRILEALGLKHNATARPLIGLTATPFRGGEDQEETERLVNRFHRVRLDHGAFVGDDQYAALQELGVLARAEHMELQGATVHLSNSEIAHLEEFKVLHPEAARRLGEVASRNRTIVDSIKALPPDWPVLVFATSVDHAFLLAALLSAAGIEAKAISGQTDVGSRRHYIREFRAGRLRVLTNYGVLTTGFDAPSVRALYVTRPVFSRVLYQQMLGRGLRGPLNGGKERCLIVNVNDNVAQYGHQLAFRHFEHLWDGSLAPQ